MTLSSSLFRQHTESASHEEKNLLSGLHWECVFLFIMQHCHDSAKTSRKMEDIDNAGIWKEYIWEVYKECLHKS